MIPLKLLLVDDSAAFLRALSGYLGTQPHLQVVGTARSGRPARPRARAGARPEMPLRDCRLRGGVGLGGLPPLGAELRGGVSTSVSPGDARPYREAAAAYGAAAFVSKARLNHDLLATIQHVAAHR